MTVKTAAAKVIAPEAAPVVDMSEELQRRRKAAAKASQQRMMAKAAAAPSAPPADQQGSQPSRGRRAWESTRAAATDQTGAPGWFQSAANPDPIRAANAGSGFVLGVLLWVTARAYLEGGPAGVKKLLKAKFFNKVDG